MSLWMTSRQTLRASCSGSQSPTMALGKGGSCHQRVMIFLRIVIPLYLLSIISAQYPLFRIMLQRRVWTNPALDVMPLYGAAFQCSRSSPR